MCVGAWVSGNWWGTQVCERELEREKASADVLFTNESLFWNGYTFDYNMTLRENIDTVCLVWKHIENHMAM